MLLGRFCAVALVMALFSGCSPAVNVPGVWCTRPSDCGAPNECSYNRCRPRCTLGSECPSNLCLAGHCSVAEDRGCTSMVGRTCARALTCAEDRCSTLCTTSCAGGAVCHAVSSASFSICVSATETFSDGGTTNDADAGH